MSGAPVSSTVMTKFMLCTTPSLSVTFRRIRAVCVPVVPSILVTSRAVPMAVTTSLARVVPLPFFFHLLAVLVSEVSQVYSSVP